MRPSEWLTRLAYIGLYRQSKAKELWQFGIVYDEETGLLTSGIVEGQPYSTYGRLGHIDRWSLDEAIRQARVLGIALDVSKLKDDPPGTKYVFGLDIITGVWRLLHDIKESGPPSAYVNDPFVKAEVDLISLRRNGY